MSKKLIIIISVTLAIFVLALIGYYFIIKGNNAGTDNNTNVFKSFLPFGGNENNPSTPSNNDGEDTPSNTTPQPNFTQKLRNLSENAVAGAGVLDVKAGSIVRYIEKATGHIYEVELFSPNKARISNTTIPTVYDAIWGNKNNSLIARYLKEDDKTIDTYGLTVKEISTSTENSISGVIFPANLSDVSVYDASVFTLQQSDNSSSGYISNFDGTKRKQIWNSPIKELLSQYVNPKTVALTTKPAPNIPGFLYTVDTGTGSVKKILGNIPGLSALVSPDISSVLYFTQSSVVRMSLLTVSGASSKEITPYTFPEKCVFSKKDKTILYCAVSKGALSGSSLTLWYQGVISFSDDIWKYDLKNNTSTMIEDLSLDASRGIDVIKPILSDNEQYLIFMNKKDNSLWSLDISKT
jgi:hypothetical protein